MIGVLPRLIAAAVMNNYGIFAHPADIHPLVAAGLQKKQAFRHVVPVRVNRKDFIGVQPADDVLVGRISTFLFSSYTKIPHQAAEFHAGAQDSSASHRN